MSELKYGGDDSACMLGLESERRRRQAECDEGSLIKAGRAAGLGNASRTTATALSVSRPFLHFMQVSLCNVIFLGTLSDNKEVVSFRA